jgi:hypothetical protein
MYSPRLTAIVALALELMKGPADPRPPTPDFGRISGEHAQIFVAIMGVLHTEPTAAAFGRLLKKSLQADDYMLLAHVFEEIGVLALHHLVPEALLFDAFAFDLYWDELREDVLALRAETGNEKFCENFELAAERAREYRSDRPPKLRWKHRGGPDAPGEPPEGLGVRPPRRPPQGAPSGSPSPVGSKET